MTDPLAAYLDLFTRLEKRARWKIAGPWRRVVAMVLATTPLRDPFDSLEGAAAVLRKRSGWFGPLSSPLRYCVAAMVLRRGLDPEGVHTGVVEALSRLEGRKLPWKGMGRTLAAVLIALRHPDGRSPERVFERAERIHRLWKADHPWLTGDDDLPLLAFHSLGDEGPEALSNRIEGIYQALREGGLPRGNPLQLASQLLGVLPWSPREAAGRFAAIRRELEAHGVKVGRTLFDEVALLSLLPAEPGALVRHLLADQDRLLESRPRPEKELALGLATGIALARREMAAAARFELPELSALGHANALHEAEQAATMAVMSSCYISASVAAAAASS